jgi:carbon monoxide dehydrogenase subunit G
MIVEDAFSVAAPMEDVFDALQDVRTMLPCLDARVTEVVDGHTARGELTVPMGDDTMVFAGTLRVGEADREAGAITYEVSGHGAGRATAKGHLAVRLRQSDSGTTRVSMHADVDVAHSPLRLDGEGPKQAARRVLSRLGDEVTARLVSGEPAPIRGTVKLAAPPVPVPAGRPANLAGAFAEQVRKRPWIVPAVLLGGASVALLVMRRGAKGDER